VSLVMPSRWAVDGFDAMTWRGFDFSTVILPSGMLLLFALVFGIIAFTRFRWDTE
jgi:ABC-2 type transport system permease protein